MRRSHFAMASLVALATVASSCRGTTALHFVVCLDWDHRTFAQQQLENVRITVINAQGRNIPSAGETISVTADTPFPLRFSVYSSSDPRETISVRVEGIFGAATMGRPAELTTTVRASFVPGEVRTIPVLLQRGCANFAGMGGMGGSPPVCPDDQTTCRVVDGARQCVSINVDSTRYESGAASMCGAFADGSVPTDATVDVQRPTDGGGGMCEGTPVDITFSGPMPTRITHLTIARASTPGQWRVAAIGDTPSGTHLYTTTVSASGPTLVPAGPAFGAMLADPATGLGFSSSGVYVTTSRQVVFSTDGRMLQPLPTFPMLNAPVLAGDLNTMMAGPLTFVCGVDSGANISCARYTTTGGVPVPFTGTMPPAPPPLPTGASSPVLQSLTVIGMPSNLVAGLRTANGFARCAVLSPTMQFGCANAMRPNNAASILVPDDNTTVPYALVSPTGQVEAGIATYTAGSPPSLSMPLQPTMLSTGAGSASISAAYASSSRNMLVVTSEANRIVFSRRRGNGTASMATVLPTGGPNVIAALPTAENVAGGEQFVVVNSAGSTRLQVRFVSATQCF
ncbi:MAG: hypothetical protein JNK05_06350 [Myxococcales bacterium]|nr:hypothetical protein [Myxococcales bacterium]